MDCSFFARITKIEFCDFRNIEKGSVEFPNSTVTDFIDGNPSIIGLYGQNGSGKSSVIMALGILKDLLSGKSLGDKYQSCIRFGCDKCTLTFTFSMFSKIFNDQGQSILNNEDASCYNVFYKFDIVRHKEDFDEFNFEAKVKDTLKIENESIKYRITTSDGKVVVPKQTFIDTSSVKFGKKLGLFGSEDKEDYYTDFDESIAQKYRDNLAVVSAKSQSFVFSPKTLFLIESSLNNCFFCDEETIDILTSIVSELQSADSFQSAINNISNKIERDDDYLFTYVECFLITTPYWLVKSLKTFGSIYLHVIDTITTGLTNINTQLPLLLWFHMPKEGVYSYRIPLKMNGPTCVEERIFNNVKKALFAVSDVLEKIVPGVRLNFVDLGIKLSENNSEEHFFEITSQRDNITIPLKYESDGIRRIVSILSLLIAAYNDESFTVAIDEIDSGIFEYLLGELLTVLSESIKGQLIFTSHNLRPLEVLPSKFLCFTTTDSAKRFTKISSRGNSNLRDTYFRSIVLDTQKDSVYNPTDKYEIELAFYKAGHYEVDSDE